MIHYLLTVLTRDEVESEMRFLGLLVMKNLVKPESPEVISTLRQARLRTVMITGMSKQRFYLQNTDTTPQPGSIAAPQSLNSLCNTHSKHCCMSMYSVIINDFAYLQCG